MSNYNNYSSWREDRITIQAGEVKTIDFLQTSPNMFLVQNPNEAFLKVSISKIPRSNMYEFLVGQNASETLGRPMPTKHLYILNDSSKTADVTVYSVQDTFDMNILKNLSLMVESATFETDGIVKGFQAGVSLPSGTNTLGKIELGDNSKTSLDTQLEAIKNAINDPTAFNAELVVTLENIKDAIDNVASKCTLSNTKIDQVKATVGQVKTAIIASNNPYCQEYKCISVENGSGLKSYLASEYVGDPTLWHIKFITNDGDNPIKIRFCTIEDPSGISATNSIWLMSGETLQDLKPFCTEIKISGTNENDSAYKFSYRMMVGRCVLSIGG